MITENQINSELKELEKQIKQRAKSRRVHITTSAVSEILGVSRETANNRMWIWKEMGVAEYVAKNATSGDFYLLLDKLKG